MVSDEKRTGAGPPPGKRDRLAEIASKLRACMQCGTCSGSCGSAREMDLMPRQLWNLVLSGSRREIIESRTFWLCSSCYLCTLRCPRGLPLTDSMAALKRTAIEEGWYTTKKTSSLFYKAFLRTVRQYGRVREGEMMSRYFLALKNPVVPLRFASLGIKLLMKGKLSVATPCFGRGKLDTLYRKARELETEA